jgi:hypothetical protein
MHLHSKNEHTLAGELTDAGMTRMSVAECPRQRPPHPLCCTIVLPVRKKLLNVNGRSGFTCKLRFACACHVLTLAAAVVSTCVRRFASGVVGRTGKPVGQFQHACSHCCCDPTLPPETDEGASRAAAGHGQAQRQEHRTHRHTPQRQSQPQLWAPAAQGSSATAPGTKS